MTVAAFFITLGQLALVAIVALLSHYHYSWLAGAAIVAPAAYRWLRGGRGVELALKLSPEVIVGLSAVILIGLHKPPYGVAVFPVITQVGVAIALAAWLVWLRQLRHHQTVSLGATAVQQAVGVSAVFLAAAFWHWPAIVVVALIWGVVFTSSLWYLKGRSERADTIMAAAWALVAAEIAWVLYTWQVNYIIGSGNYLIIPQATITVFGTGYCFASIYHSHKEKRLSRRRLIEYVAIAGVLLAIVIAGTRWNGSA